MYIFWDVHNCTFFTFYVLSTFYYNIVLLLFILDPTSFFSFNFLSSQNKGYLLTFVFRGEGVGDTGIIC